MCARVQPRAVYTSLEALQADAGAAGPLAASPPVPFSSASCPFPPPARESVA